MLVKKIVLQFWLKKMHYNSAMSVLYMYMYK